VGYDVLVLDPDPLRDPGGIRFVTSAAEAGLDGRTDVVVTDHDRPELGDVLADVLGFEPRWIGLMGSMRVDPPHLGPLRERGFDDTQVARVHRPIGLDIGSRSPAEIAVSTVAGLIADRNGRTGGPFAVPNA
jgi:xanthine/CO dehydrogenase XdhC/CoxF family maturation factor